MAMKFLYVYLGQLWWHTLCESSDVAMNTNVAKMTKQTTYRIPQPPVMPGTVG